MFGCALASIPVEEALAHHSYAMFDAQHTVTLTGTVREFQWANPHCFIQLLVRNDKGTEEEWSIEMGAPLHLSQLGVTRSMLKAGDRITVVIQPLRNGAKGGNFVSATLANGKPLGDAP
jgi:hypothetical protein